MDSPLTRGEHEEFRGAINATINRLEQADARLDERISALEGDNTKITELTVNIQKLTDSIENMRKLQEDEGKRLTAIESRDGEMWRKAVGYVVTTIIGIILGFIFTQFGM